MFSVPSEHTSLLEKWPYSEFSWSVFSRIQTEYGDLICKSLHLVRMREITDQEKLWLGTLFMQYILVHGY